jgi:hypothetical protein
MFRHLLSMTYFNLLQFLTVLFSGLLAGVEVAVHYGLGSPPRSLNEEARIRLRQAMILRLRILAPALFLPTLASAISLTIKTRHEPSIWLHLAALALLGVWIVIRVLRTVPVNSATLEWNPLSPPEGWQAQIERTERFHVFATWAAVAAFTCFLLSAVSGL